MEPMIILLAIGPNGEMRCAQTTNPEVPEEWVRPGEIAFTVYAADIKARHTHEPLPPIHHPMIDP